MTPAEEEVQRQANQRATAEFMERLGEAAAAEDDRPQTEEEADRMLEESDRLADRIAARMEREGSGADYERILEEELERRRRERGEEPPTPEQEAQRAEWIEEMNRAMEEAANDPEPSDEEDREHPLATRAFEFSVQLHREVEKRGWQPAEAGPEHPVAELVASVMKASAKMAGALNGEECPPPVEFCAQSIARLKRAANHLGDAQLAAEACAEQGLTAPDWLAGVRRELAALARDTDAIIAELRERLKRGFD
jgi:hypothetical protein